MTDITAIVVPEFAGAGGAFTNGQYNTLNNAVTALTTSVNNLALSDYNGAIVAGVTAYANGTAYGSMTDSAAGINTAATNASAAGKRLVLVGTFRVDSTVTLFRDFDLSMATFVCSSTSIAPLVRVGTAVNGSNVDTIAGCLPNLINAAQVVGSGWAGTSVGVEIANLLSSRIYFQEITGFVDGFKCTAYQAGCAYSDFYVGYLNNNKRNGHLTPADTTGYVNENTFYGGRWSHKTAEGTNVSGVRQLLIDHPASGNRCNNNRFIGPSLEGNVPEYHVDIDGSSNLIFWARWEASLGPKVKWTQVSAGDAAQFNRIVGGWNSESITVTKGANTAWNNIESTEQVRRSTNAANPLLVLQNKNSQSTPLLTFLTTGTDIDSAAAVLANYRIAISSALIAMKLDTDVENRFQVSSASGTLTWGDGALAGDVTLSRSAADLLTTGNSDSFKVGSGAWNGGHLMIGSYHLWVDATGDLRIKSSAPASDLDGTVVGTQS